MKLTLIDIKVFVEPNKQRWQVKIVTEVNEKTRIGTPPRLEVTRLNGDSKKGADALISNRDMTQQVIILAIGGSQVVKATGKQVNLTSNAASFARDLNKQIGL